MPRRKFIDVTDPKAIREALKRFTGGRNNRLKVEYLQAMPGKTEDWMHVKIRVKGTVDTGPIKVTTDDGRRLVVHNATEDRTGTYTWKNVQDMPVTESALKTLLGM